MNVEAAIRSMLAADPVVSPIVGTRIYLRMVPETVEYPALTFFLVTEEPIHEMSRGLSGTYEAQIQVSSWAKDSGGKSAYAISRELSRAVRKALVGTHDAATTIHVQAITEDQTISLDSDVATGIEQIATTFTVIYSELTPEPPEPPDEEEE